MNMNEIITILLLIGFGGLFLYAAFLSYKKDWKVGAYISIVLAAFFIIMALPATRNFMRATAWSAFVTGLEATGQGLLKLNNTIDDIRNGMEIEQQKRENQQRKLDEVQKDTLKMYEDLQAAQKDIESQQKKISDINQLIKSIFEKGKTVFLKTSEDNDKLILFEHEDNKVTLYALLPEAPISQTLQLQYHVSLQPKNSYWIQNNLVTFRWGQSIKRLREKGISFTYIPDPTNTDKYEKLETKNSRVFADGQPLLYGFVELDPVFEYLQKKAKEGGSGLFSPDMIKQALNEIIKEPTSK